MCVRSVPIRSLNRWGGAPHFLAFVLVGAPSADQVSAV
jgi:hypothetical protein